LPEGTAALVLPDIHVLHTGEQTSLHISEPIDETEIKLTFLASFERVSSTAVVHVFTLRLDGVGSAEGPKEAARAAEG